MDERNRAIFNEASISAALLLVDGGLAIQGRESFRLAFKATAIALVPPNASVNEKAKNAEGSVGHRDHQVNALIVSGRRIVHILRTGGGRHRFLSGGARISGTRRGQDDH